MMRPASTRRLSYTPIAICHFVLAVTVALSAACPVSSARSEDSAPQLGAKRRHRVIRPAAKAKAERARCAAYRPYEESSGRRIDYGGKHPFERPAQRRRAVRTSKSKSKSLSVRTSADADDVETAGADAHSLDAHDDSSAAENDADNDAPPPPLEEYDSPTRPLRIRFITDALDMARGESVEKDRKIDAIEHRVLPAIADTWTRALSVVPLAYGGFIRIPPDACNGLAKIGEDSMEVYDADIVVLVDVASLEELACTPGGDNSLGVGGPCYTDQYDRPVISFMNFCLEDYAVDDSRYDGDEDVDPEEEVAELITIGTHEMAHCLGHAVELIKYWRNPLTGVPLTPRPFKAERVPCVDGSIRDEYRPSWDVLAMSVSSNGATYYEVVTPKLATVAKNHFNCDKVGGVRLENQPTSEVCFGSHLDERLFYTELMGPMLSGFSNALSPVTLAYFEDSSWYVANYTAAAPSTFGHGAGCDFVYEDCIEDGRVPDYSKGFFCGTKMSVDPFGSLADAEGLSCDPTRTHKAFCNLARKEPVAGLSDTIIPEPFQYFPKDKDMGAHRMRRADFCPIASIDYMDCQDADNDEPGEYFGLDSRCYDVAVISPSEQRGSPVPQAMCFRTICNAERNVVELEVGSSRIVCDRDGQIHSLTALDGAGLECPRFAVVCPELICPGNCAGKGRCNWDTGKCECFDAADMSPGCFRGIVNESPLAESSGPSTTDEFQVPDSDDEQIIVLGPRKSAAAPSLSSIGVAISSAGTLLTASALVLTTLLA